MLNLALVLRQCLAASSWWRRWWASDPQSQRREKESPAYHALLSWPLSLLATPLLWLFTENSGAPSDLTYCLNPEWLKVTYQWWEAVGNNWTALFSEAPALNKPIEKGGYPFPTNIMGLPCFLLALLVVCTAASKKYRNITGARHLKNSLGSKARFAAL